MSRFEAQRVAMIGRQGKHLLRVGTLLSRTKRADLDTIRREHDAIIDPLARALLDSLVEEGNGGQQGAEILRAIVETTCLTIRRNRSEIEQAVKGAWTLVIVMEDFDYAYRFTEAGRNANRFALLEHALEVIKAWILVTEHALDRTPLFQRDRFIQHSARHITARKYLKRGHGRDPSA